MLKQSTSTRPLTTREIQQQRHRDRTLAQIVELYHGEYLSLAAAKDLAENYAIDVVHLVRAIARR